jgi:hypothetical protein
MAKQRDTRRKAAEPEAPRQDRGPSADRRGERTMAALYAEARRRDIPGRSKMNKALLERVLA